jgi:hypothetical protein
MEQLHQAGVGEGASKASGNFDRYRGINVLVGEQMRPHINQLGNLPSRDELDQAVKPTSSFSQTLLPNITIEMSHFTTCSITSWNGQPKNQSPKCFRDHLEKGSRCHDIALHRL